MLYYNDLSDSNRVASKIINFSFFILYYITIIYYLYIYTYYLTIMLLIYYNINELQVGSNMIF